MVDLAEHYSGESIRLKDIAKRQNITLKYMEQIMPLLTRAGYVRSFRGNSGGYMLSKAPEEYTVGDILRVTEGNLAPIPCIETDPNLCERRAECRTVAFWEGMWKVINEYADSVTLADLAHSDVEYYI